MGSSLFACLTLCLLVAGPGDPRIIQKPKHLVTVMGSERTLICEQYQGHNAMYWYRQSATQSLELMFSYNYQKLFENQTLTNRFRPHSREKSHLDLQITALQPDDSATYFCASSQDTALQSSCRPVHKPPPSLQETAGVTGPPSPKTRSSSPGGLKQEPQTTTAPAK